MTRSGTGAAARSTTLAQSTVRRLSPDRFKDFWRNRDKPSTHATWRATKRAVWLPPHSLAPRDQVPSLVSEDLGAQQQVVANYLNGGDWSIVAEFTEIESGKRSDWPELDKALAAAGCIAPP
jgi:hypothetical protein